MAAKKRPTKRSAPPQTPRKSKSAKRPASQGKAPRTPEPDPSGLTADRPVDAAASPGCPVVGIGASAGGLDGFKKFLGAMPADGGAAIVLVPHLAPTHQSLMVELLTKQTRLPVVEAGEGMVVEPNHVYIIPPNKYLTIHDGALRLTGPMESGGATTSIDLFFRSLADDQQERAICIILSGTGSHGTLGLRAVKANGCMAMVQDPETAEFDRMPQSAIATGLVDYVLPPEQMPAALVEYLQHSYVNGGSLADRPDEGTEQLSQVLALLRARTKFDFRCYRKKMPLRRVKRRMSLHQIDQIPQYLSYLREHPEEVQQLAKDLLISVTSFFRDPEAYHVLQSRVIPDLLHNKDSDQPLRVWVPGCATGEEAYSLAILLLEGITSSQTMRRLQIFATDIDEEALEIARQGVYPDSIAADVTPERLAKFFTRSGDHSYQVSKHLREVVTFAVQNLISDAPFSKLDLVSCRNLLIYLEPDVQRKVIALLHFALHDGGYLMLGPSETIGPQVDLFEVAVKKWRVYRRIGAGRPERVDFPISPAGENPPVEAAAAAEANVPWSKGFAELTRQMLLENYAPAAVLIDRKYLVHYFFGPTPRYLEQQTGEPTHDLLLLARDGLRNKLRRAIRQAINERQAVSVTATPSKRNGNEHAVRMTVRPVQAPKAADGLLLVTFEEGPETEPTVPDKPEGSVDEALVNQLEAELDATRHDLQSTIEEMETSNEQLKASNEEVTSVNEELQSANEELETSKEELQSLNEELNTVNNQLREKVDELERTNNDLANLLSSTDVATIFLDARFRIERFTPATNRLMNLIERDVGRPLGDIAPKFVDGDLLPDCKEVQRTLVPREKEIQTQDGRWCLRRVLPYRTLGDKIEGVVITFVDVTLVKQAAALRESRDRLAAVLDSAGDGLVTLDDRGAIDSFNKTAEKMFGFDVQGAVGRPVSALLPSTFTMSPEKYLAQYVNDAIGVGREGIGRRKDGSTFPVALSISELEFAHQRLFTLLIRDISSRRALEKEVLDATLREQRRIGQDLHDSVGQELTSLRLLAENLAGSCLDQADPNAELAGKLTAGVKRLFSQVRAMTQGLVPREIYASELPIALEELCAQVGAQSQVVCAFEGGEWPAWDNDFAATHVFRIAQEAVANALKHAHARHIRISLQTTDHRTELKIADDGRGISDKEAGEGLGMRTMRYRADLINGELTVKAGKKGGTIVTCSFLRDESDAAAQERTQ